MSDSQALAGFIMKLRPDLDADSAAVLALGVLKLADDVEDYSLDVSSAHVKFGGDVRRKSVPLLGPKLRELRERAVLTQEVAAGRAEWSLSKLLRIEKNSVGVSPGDMRHILLVYGITDEAYITEMIRLAKAHKQALLDAGKRSRLRAAQRLAANGRQAS